MRAIAYIRVSTEKQVEGGASLESQEKKIRAMAEVQGAKLVEIIGDGGESAKSLARPGMERLLSLVDTGKVNVVIIAKLDRLTRSVKDLAELLERIDKRGVSLVSVADSLDTETATGRLVLASWPTENILSRSNRRSFIEGAPPKSISVELPPVRK